MTCCVCEDRSKHVQIHHLDRNPNNNAPDNLVVLCLEHHDEATRRSGIGRSLSKGQLRKYREQWLEKVHSRRVRAFSKAPPVNEDIHEALLEALACHEVRRIQASLVKTKWEKQVPLLEELLPYTTFSYGRRVRGEILWTLHRLADRTRHGMPSAVAWMIRNIALSTMPLTSLVHRERRRISDENKALLRSAIELGYSLAYDGVKHLANLKVTAAGAGILYDVLRYAHLNDLRDLKDKAIGEFNDLIDAATKRRYEDAARWLKFERDDALALRGDPLPTLPEDIMRKLHNH
jgi:hypothetical protein